MINQNCCLPWDAVFNRIAAENLKSLDSLLAPFWLPLKRALDDQYVEIGSISAKYGPIWPI